jgi:hypothetical protein
VLDQEVPTDDPWGSSDSPLHRKRIIQTPLQGKPDAKGLTTLRWDRKMGLDYRYSHDVEDATGIRVFRLT